MSVVSPTSLLAHTEVDTPWSIKLLLRLFSYILYSALNKNYRNAAQFEMDFVKCSADFTFGSTINPKPVRSKFLTKVLGFFENSRESLTVIPGKFFRVNLGQHS